MHEYWLTHLKQLKLSFNQKVSFSVPYKESYGLLFVREATKESIQLNQKCFQGIHAKAFFLI